MEHESVSDINCNQCAWNNAKWLGKGTGRLKMRGQVETIQTKALLRSARILKKSWRLEETCYHTNSSERLFANAVVKKTLKIVK